MNLCVCIKQVPDTETRVALNPAGNGLDGSDVKWVVSAFDEIAIEESLRIRERNPGTSVTVYSAGPSRVSEAVRSALALGADQGVRIELPEDADPFMTARALANAIAKQTPPELILLGRESSDGASGLVGTLVAEHLSLPCVTGVSSIEYFSDRLRCCRPGDRGSTETVEVRFPCVITVQKGLNSPRYATLPNVLKAKKKEIPVLQAADLGVSEGDRKIRYGALRLSAGRKAAKRVSGTPTEQAAELVRLLRDEAGVDL